MPNLGPNSGFLIIKRIPSKTDCNSPNCFIYEGQWVGHVDGVLPSNKFMEVKNYILSTLVL